MLIIKRVLGISFLKNINYYKKQTIFVQTFAQIYKKNEDPEEN